QIVVRRLPSTMTSENFMQFVAPLGLYDYYYFVQGSVSGDPFSRAYINFVNLTDLWLFKDKFDGYIFLNDKGSEFPAVVEYAPFHKISSGKQKVDHRVASIATGIQLFY
ncbi:hypothetical protein HELRODRAFT_65972, partial [Helobdella robusta]|uniref:UPF3 domain-containing protein n=1 Tax=Helobdella robusta TaxID=6412 RepID=T1FYF5_HELRO